MTTQPGNDSDRLRRVARLAKLLDAQFRIPGTRIRFGLDALIGLVPGIGDVIVGGFSLVILFLAWQAGVSGAILVRMFINILLDVLIGAIPLVGDLFDVFFKANMRNARLLQRELQRKRAADVVRSPSTT